MSSPLSQIQVTDILLILKLTVTLGNVFVASGLGVREVYVCGYPAESMIFVSYEC